MNNTSTSKQKWLTDEDLDNFHRACADSYEDISPAVRDKISSYLMPILENIVRPTLELSVSQRLLERSELSNAYSFMSLKAVQMGHLCFFTGVERSRGVMLQDDYSLYIIAFSSVFVKYVKFSINKLYPPKLYNQKKVEAIISDAEQAIYDVAVKISVYGELLAEKIIKKNIVFNQTTFQRLLRELPNKIDLSE